MDFPDDVMYHDLNAARVPVINTANLLRGATPRTLDGGDVLYPAGYAPVTRKIRRDGVRVEVFKKTRSFTSTKKWVDIEGAVTDGRVKMRAIQDEGNGHDDNSEVEETLVGEGGEMDEFSR